VRAIKQLGLTSAWLDGEIVVLEKNGAPSFQALQNAFDTEDTQSIQLFLFDLPYLNGYDLRAVPLQQRRAALRSILGKNPLPALHFSEDFRERPHDILAAACKLSLEGVIGKRRDAPYVSGRSKTWIKLKCGQRQEFIVGGYTAPQGSRSGFGALLLGVHDADGELRYAGRVGTGFDEKLLRSVYAALQPLKVSKSAFANPPSGRLAQGVQWVRPTLVAEASFAQWTEGGIVRHAVFHGLRIDKPAREIGREKTDMPDIQKKKSKTALQKNGDSVAGVAISHPDRVIDPFSGVTKIELARYYEAISARLLPHLKARPVALLRAPEGINAEQFFQKHRAHLAIPKVRILGAKLDPGHEPLMVIDSTEALVGAAQMGTLELHTWNAIATSIERPDRMIFDLDPDPALPWSRMVEAATLTKALLDELGLQSFLKTSGGKGLHLVVPLARRHSWDSVKRFSQAVAEHLAATISARFSAKMGPKNRIKKVFVDYLRNRRGASTVAAFSARARPGIAVSTPIHWDELAELKGSDHWTIRNLSGRLENLKNDPWQSYAKTRQSLSRAATQLGVNLVDE
jgi:bifunctional non-homologous end joining protein LigD